MQYNHFKRLNIESLIKALSMWKRASKVFPTAGRGPALPAMPHQFCPLLAFVCSSNPAIPHQFCLPLAPNNASGICERCTGGVPFESRPPRHTAPILSAAGIRVRSHKGIKFAIPPSLPLYRLSSFSCQLLLSKGSSRQAYPSCHAYHGSDDP
jgi:hypothetical protein